jgi:uncharacterized protein
MIASTLRPALQGLLPVLAIAVTAGIVASIPQDRSPTEAREPDRKETAVQVHYLEIVTPDVEIVTPDVGATCDALAKLHAVTFAAPAPELGNARTAKLRGGGLVGVRAPMRPDEEPVVRPYVLVDDIAAAVEKAKTAGGEIALPPTEIAGRGQCAIYVQGGIQHGLWEL